MKHGKYIALLIAFGFPIAFFLFFDHCDTFSLLGKHNRPRLKRYSHLAPNSTQTNQFKYNDTLWHTIPSFAFEGHNGKTITLDYFEDKVAVVDFFFTHCPSICPQMTAQLERVQHEFRNYDEVVILSHTVDPARDSIPRLIEYANTHEVDSTKWVMVTGNKKELYQQARQGYFITATEGDGGDDDFVHSEKLVIVDKDKVIRGYYDGTKEEEVNQMMFDIKTLLLEYPVRKRKELKLQRKREVE